AFGVNIESITIVVAVFMFGLGLGSIMGGLLSKRFPDKLPQLFLIFEVLIGIFGVFSIPLIKAVSATLLFGDLWSMSLAVFALLSIPTFLMGATLPVLVSYLYKRYQSVGRSVGLLYFINTLGSA